MVTVLFEQITVSLNNCDHVIEVVSYACGELTNSIHFLCLQQLSLGRDLLSYVAGDGRYPNHPVVLVAHRIGTDRDVDIAAILCATLGLQTTDRTSAIYDRLNVAKFLLSTRNCKNGDVLSNYLLGGVAIHLFRGGIPIGDDSI